MPASTRLLISQSRDLYQWSRQNLPLILLLATLFLFISKSLYNIPVAIMALLGLYRCVTRSGAILEDRITGLFILFFMCLWIPLLISLIDAVNPPRSAKTVFGYLRFLFMGIYLLHDARDPEIWGKLRLGVFCLMAFWCVDAIIQFIFKANLLGYPYEPGHYVNGYVTGMFYPRYTIAPVTAVLSPIYFDFIREKSRQTNWLWALIIPLFMVILLSGRRGAWVMLFVSVTGYLYYLFRRQYLDARMKKVLAFITLVIFTILCLTVIFTPPLQKRMQDTMKLFSGDYEQMDVATSRRLPIWKASVDMIRSHWINGIGPRGYRYVYNEYSESDDYWVELSIAPYHPHQMYLEILVETGIIGLAGFIAGLFWTGSFLRREELLIPLFPILLCVAVAIFPLNTHLAFYSTYWSSFIWWLFVLVFIVAGLKVKRRLRVQESEK